MMKIRRLAELEQYSNAFDFISFDLFDTLVFRENLSLQAIKESSACYFIGLLARVNAGRNFTIAEAVAARTQFTLMLKGSFRVVTEEPSIESVYESMALSCGVDLEDAKDISVKVADYEFSLDCLSLELMPGAIDTLRNLIGDGKTLFLVSDMYYRQERIVKILRHFLIDDCFAQVFVSASENKTKQTGNLFNVLLDTQKLDPNSVLHIGDNARSDVQMAGEVGLNAVYFDSGTHYLADKQRPLSGLPVIDKFGNLSSLFVIQVLQRAWALGLDKVFFLTRDATALGSVLESLCVNAPFLAPLLDRVEFKELALSRSSATFLELSSGDSTLDEVLFRFCWIFGGRFELGRLKSFFADASDGVVSLVIPESLEDFSVGENVEDEASRLREQCPALADEIVESARSLGKTTYRYLLQEGAVGCGDVGFVDVGYTATVTRNIAHYLTKEAPKHDSSNTHIHLFFMASGVLLDSNLKVSLSHVSAEYVMNEFDELPTILRTNYCWFECFAKDYSRGPLLGYRSDGSGLSPVFASQSDVAGPLSAWLGSQSPSEFDVLNLLSRSFGVAITKDYFKEMAFPNSSTIDYIDTLSHGCGLMDDQERSIVNRSLTMSNFMPNGLRAMIRQDYWIAGSVRASGFGNWANIWVGASIAVVRKIKNDLRAFNKHFRKVAKRVLN